MDAMPRPAAPVEPLEELYYALAELQGKVDSSRLSILMSTKTSVWVNGRKNTSFTADDLAELTAKGSLVRHYSDRYGCAYLAGFTANNMPLIAWYLDEQSMEARARLARRAPVAADAAELGKAHQVYADASYQNVLQECVSAG